MDPDKLIDYITKNPQQAKDIIDQELARESFIEFVELLWPTLEPHNKFRRGWVMEAMCEHLQAITDGHINRLVINVPPGLSKSLLTSVFFPAFEWGPRELPYLSYICCSYSLELARRDNNRFRDLITSDLYRRLYPHIILEKEGDNLLKNTIKGSKIIGSVGASTVTGKRGDRGILDDPLSVEQSHSPLELERAARWFSQTWPSRINNPETAAQILIMQRLHQKDITGLILEDADNLGYTALILPMEYESERRCTTSLGWSDPRTSEGEMLFPELYSKEYVNKVLKPNLRLVGGEYAIAGQLQQRPSPKEGAMFKVGMIKQIPELSDPILARIRAWDLAATKNAQSAFTVGVLMSITKNGQVLIEDVRRGRWDSKQVFDMIKRCCKEDPVGTVASLPKDPGQAGVLQADLFRDQLRGFNFRISDEAGDKEGRAFPLSVAVENGLVYMLEGSAWIPTYLEELATFPVGKYKDQVDASARAYNELMRYKKQMRRLVGPKTIHRKDGMEDRLDGR